MYISAEQLRDNLEALDSGAPMDGVNSGPLTPEAMVIAMEIPKARGIDAGGNRTIACRQSRPNPSPNADVPCAGGFRSHNESRFS
jgi:hypothetical protein